jgi:hypothetical protein
MIWFIAVNSSEASRRRDVTHLADIRVLSTPQDRAIHKNTSRVESVHCGIMNSKSIFIEISRSEKKLSEPVLAAADKPCLGGKKAVYRTRRHPHPHRAAFTPDRAVRVS